MREGRQTTATGGVGVGVGFIEGFCSRWGSGLAGNAVQDTNEGRSL